MSIAIFDIVFAGLQSATGSFAFTIAITFFVPVILFFKAQVPPFFTFVLISPLLITFGTAGYLGTGWVVPGTYIVFGLMWALVLRQGMNLQ